MNLDNYLLFPDGDRDSDIDAYQAGYAISAAADPVIGGAHIIAMAWGSLYSYSYISDTIDYWYYAATPSGGVLFVGAAGTTNNPDWLGGGCPSPGIPTDFVIFPARKPQVMAITALNESGWTACESHYGPEVEIAAHTYQPTLGPTALGSAPTIKFAGSSAATATVSGIAALVWSRYPWMTRDQVRARLHQSSSKYPNRDSRFGYGLINAHRALGGMWYANLGGSCTTTDCTFHYKLSSCTTKTYYLSQKGGDGPYTYRWSTGSTSNSASLRICPTAGRTEYYSISGTVTDQSDGTALYRNVRIEVVSSDPDGACPTCPV